jgi:hypothetical protein
MLSGLAAGYRHKPSLIQVKQSAAKSHKLRPA